MDLYRYEASTSVLNKTGILDPHHAAQWSALSRKRKNGFALVVLYVIACEYDLDMTATMGNRLLQGLFGFSMSTRALLAAFGEHGRTASEKSADWEKIDVIIHKMKPWSHKALLRNRAKVRQNKETAWELVKQGRLG
ncbi:hypothetical protein CW311_04625 [Acinetobacter proteolyticus]|uniref:Uncharacterized protein n=2 Tax=Acinetobacter proteolyticus TaxID=1776741 RepID=A0A2N0WIF2_9GAMM|nr:hypothetical protein CW311_04625 [Acinetobacter proteolyticus]